MSKPAAEGESPSRVSRLVELCLEFDLSLIESPLIDGLFQHLGQSSLTLN